MHDIAKTLQDGPESVEEILWNEGPWLGEELEKAWENCYEVQGYSPFATCGNNLCRSKDLCVLTVAETVRFSTFCRSIQHITFWDHWILSCFGLFLHCSLYHPSFVMNLLT